MNSRVAFQAPYMIYVEVLCTSGNEDDPFPSKQFQPTLRQTRYRMFAKVVDVFQAVSILFLYVGLISLINFIDTFFL